MQKGGSPSDRRVRGRKEKDAEAAPASQEGGRGSAHSQVERAARGGSGGKDTISKLVEVLAKLSLQSSRDLAGVIGAI